MFKKFGLILAICLSACTPVATAVTVPLPTVGTCSGVGLASGTLLDEKALYAAEVAYNVPAQAYVSADSVGILTPATKAQVRPLLLGAYQALKLARAAYAAGDAGGFACQYAAVKAFASQASAYLPK